MLFSATPPLGKNARHLRVVIADARSDRGTYTYHFCMETHKTSPTILTDGNDID